MAFPTTSLLDDFNRANGALGANWSGRQAALTANVATLDTNSALGALSGGSSSWLGATYGPNVEVYGDFGSPTDHGNWFYALDSPTSATANGYVMQAFSPNFLVYRMDAGVLTQLGSSGTQAFAAGDSFGLLRSGSGVQAWYKAAAGSWAQVSTGSSSDATYTLSGASIGLAIDRNTSHIDNFGGGNGAAAALPTEVPYPVRPLTLALQKFRPGVSPFPLQFAPLDLTFIAPAQADLPPPPTVTPVADERRRQRPTSDPIVISGALLAVAPPAVLPPEPVITALLERRRILPTDPLVGHGFHLVTAPDPTVTELVERRRQDRAAPDPVLPDSILAALPAPTVDTPPAPIVVAPLERNRRIAVGGVISVGYPTPPDVTPPAPTVVDRADQRDRYRALPAIALNQAFYTVPPPSVVTPPPPVNVDRVDQRGRYRPLDPIVDSGALRTTPPFVTPPAPYVVPVEERRRLLAALPETRHGFDTGVTPFVPPPGPFVVPIQERRRLLAGGVIQSGYLGNTPANGVLPPLPLNMDRMDQRKRYLPQPSLVLSGVRAPFIPPPPVTVLSGTDWAGEMSTW